MVYLKAALLVLIVLLQGCATLAKSRIEHSLDKQHGNLLSGAQDILAELQFSTDTFCLDQNTVCTEFLIAEPIYLVSDPSEESAQESHFPPVVFTLDLISSRREHVELKLDAPEQRYNGTWILLHSFSGDKTTMMINAFALRSLGFKVVIPDLQGHGGASGPAAVDGKLDAKIISQLTDKLSSEQRISGPIYVLGYSFGANVAARLSVNRSDIAGQLLIAPMYNFSNGLQNFVAQAHVLYHKILGAEQLQRITDATLRARNIVPEDTAIAPLLAQSDVPTMLIASEQDTIAPAKYFRELQQPNLQLHLATDRTHVGLAMFDNSEWQMLQNWLLSIPADSTDSLIEAE